MRTLLVSQRVEVVSAYNERRDCLDQSWCGLLRACGFLPVPVMNDGEDMEALFEAVKPAGILLTGGNDLITYGGDAPERDETERRLIRLGLDRKIPIMGVCRGFQLITDLYGGKLTRVQRHVRQRHLVRGSITREVNSYHKLAVLRPPEGFEALAETEDGVVEAMESRTERILGIMWHPEREKPYDTEDIRLIEDFFNGSGERP